MFGSPETCLDSEREPGQDGRREGGRDRLPVVESQGVVVLPNDRPETGSEDTTHWGTSLLPGHVKRVVSAP